jgi:hypothetical protein
MPATFARTTDRPRLFDDRPSPRARRPARRTDPARAPERDRTAAAPDPATPSFDFAPPASPPASAEPHAEPDARALQPDARALQPRPAEPDARALQPAPVERHAAPDDSPAVEPATPGFDLAPADTDLAPHGHEPAASGSARDADTLDHLIAGIWDELSAHRTVSCPVCHGQMAPRYGSAELPVGGRCRRCGSTLG